MFYFFQDRNQVAAPIHVHSLMRLKVIRHSLLHSRTYLEDISDIELGSCLISNIKLSPHLLMLK